MHRTAKGAGYNPADVVDDAMRIFGQFGYKPRQFFEAVQQTCKGRPYNPAKEEEQHRHHPGGTPNAETVRFANWVVANAADPRKIRQCLVNYVGTAPTAPALPVLEAA